MLLWSEYQPPLTQKMTPAQSFGGNGVSSYGVAAAAGSTFVSYSSLKSGMGVCYTLALR